jgi:hypothetical protein
MLNLLQKMGVWLSIFVVVFIEGIRMGRKNAQADQQETVLKNVEKSKKIENDINSESTADQLNRLRDDVAK